MHWTGQIKCLLAVSLVGRRRLATLRQTYSSRGGCGTVQQRLELRRALRGVALAERKALAKLPCCSGASADGGICAVRHAARALHVSKHKRRGRFRIAAALVKISVERVHLRAARHAFHRRVACSRCGRCGRGGSCRKTIAHLGYFAETPIPVVSVERHSECLAPCRTGAPSGRGSVSRAKSRAKSRVRVARQVAHLDAGP